MNSMNIAIEQSLEIANDFNQKQSAKPNRFVSLENPNVSRINKNRLECGFKFSDVCRECCNYYEQPAVNATILDCLRKDCWHY